MSDKNFHTRRAAGTGPTPPIIEIPGASVVPPTPEEDRGRRFGVFFALL